MLFDVDGTLIDSNYLHVYEWQRVFHAKNLAVETWRIHRCIGMDGALLLNTLAGDSDDDTRPAPQGTAQPVLPGNTMLLRPLPGARELLHRVADAGLQVVLATSAPEDELAILRDALDCEDVISEVTSSGDVDTAKPEADIVHVALERPQVTADQAVFVGDAVWDAEASGRASVPCIGLLSGGVSREELESASATEVFENSRELHEEFDESLTGKLTAQL